MDLEQKIKERITVLETELERVINAANAQIASYQAAIGELKNLLEPEQPRSE